MELISLLRDYKNCISLKKVMAFSYGRTFLKYEACIKKSQKYMD